MKTFLKSTFALCLALIIIISVIIIISLKLEQPNLALFMLVLGTILLTMLPGCSTKN